MKKIFLLLLFVTAFAAPVSAFDVWVINYSKQTIRVKVTKPGSIVRREDCEKSVEVGSGKFHCYENFDKRFFDEDLVDVPHCDPEVNEELFVSSAKGRCFDVYHPAKHENKVGPEYGMAMSLFKRGARAARGAAQKVSGRAKYRLYGTSKDLYQLINESNREGNDMVLIIQKKDNDKDFSVIPIVPRDIREFIKFHKDSLRLCEEFLEKMSKDMDEFFEKYVKKIAKREKWVDFNTRVFKRALIIMSDLKKRNLRISI